MKYSFAGFSSLIAFLLVICILGYSPVVLAAPAAGKPITLTIPAHATPAYPDFDSYQRFIDRINQDGKGKVEAKFYPSETLYKVKEIVPALMNGSCEIVFYTSSHTTGSWPEIGGMSLPFLYKDDDEARA